MSSFVFGGFLKVFMVLVLAVAEKSVTLSARFVKIDYSSWPTGDTTY